MAVAALERMSLGVGKSSVLLLFPLVLLSLLLALDGKSVLLEVLVVELLLPPASGEDDHASAGGCRLAEAEAGRKGVDSLLL